MTDRVIPMTFGGLWKSGDLTTVPDGFGLEAKNVLLRPGNRLVARGGFKQVAISADYGISPIGLIKRWDQLSSKDVLYAMLTEDPIGGSGDPGTVYATSKTSGWTILETLYGGYPVDWAQMSDSTFVTVGDNASIGIKELSKDGGEIPLGDDTDAFNCGVVAGFGERIFAGDVWWDITNSLYLGGNNNVYLNSGHTWTLTGLTAKHESLPDGDLNYVFPSSGGGSTETMEKDVLLYGADVTFRAALRNRSRDTACPVTISIYVATKAARNTSYTVGTARRPDTVNGYYYVITAVAGDSTTGGAEPVWPTTIGGEVTDNNVTWRCVGEEDVAKLEVDVPASDDVDNLFSGFYVQNLNFTYSQTYLGVRITLGNTSGTTWPTDGLDVGFLDGIADGAATKKSWGQQFTPGRLKLPFNNVEDSGYNRVFWKDRLIWSEIRELTFRAQDFASLYQTSGTITMMCSLAGRLIVAKENSIYIYNLIENPNFPLDRERLLSDVGCIGPKAYDILGDTLFFIGNDEVYMMGPGSDPQPLAQDAMREEIFDHGSDWVPDQTTYKYPLLCVDKLNKEVHVYTQKGRVFVYNISTQKWTEFAISYDVSASPDELADMIWFDNALWYSCKNLGVGYFDETKVDGDGTTGYPIEVTYDFPVVEARGPRTELFIDWMDLHHRISVAGSLTMQLSRDGDTNFDVLNTITVRTAADGKTEKQEVDVQQVGVSHRMRLTRTTTLSGPSTMTLTGAELHVQILGEESPVDQTSSTASTL